MMLIGTGRTRSSYLLSDGLALKTAREGEEISPELWARHAEHLMDASDVLETVRVHRVGAASVVVDYAPGPMLAAVVEPTAEQRAGLRDVVGRCCAAGVYVGDLNPRNLVWSRGRWLVVDCGSSRRKTSREIRTRLAHKWRRVPWAVCVARGEA